MVGKKLESMHCPRVEALGIAPPLASFPPSSSDVLLKIQHEILNKNPRVDDLSTYQLLPWNKSFSPIDFEPTVKY